MRRASGLSSPASSSPISSPSSTSSSRRGSMFVSSCSASTLLCCLLLSSLVVLSHVPARVSGAVESVSDLLSSYAAASVSVGSHRDISSVHVLDAYVVYEGHEGDGDEQALSHFHPLSHTVFRTLDAASGLPAYSHRASSRGALSESGGYQPFPARVQLSFSAFDVQFALRLTRVPSVWVLNASVSVRDGWDREVAAAQPEAPLDSTYWALEGDYLDDNWAVATLREDGRFHATIQHEGEVYQADPIEHFRPHMDERAFHTLATASQRGMAVYRHSDLINQHDKQCGTDAHQHANQRPGQEQDDLTQQADVLSLDVHEDDEQAVTDSHGHSHSHSHSFGYSASASASSSHAMRNSSSPSSSPSSSRRLLQLQANDEWPTAANLVNMNIFNIFATPQRMPYQFVVDAGFYSLFNSVQDVQAAVTSVVVASNIILLKQTQLFIQINGITIMTQPNPSGGPNPWNQAAYPAGTHACPNYDPGTQLTDMNNYRINSHPTQGAAHHLFTNCWPAPGIVGISYIGWTCSADYAISVSSYNSPFWQTVVHEIGHTLGAEHTFATSSWAGGGIMDYYVDSRYPIATGPYQFAPPNEAQMQYWVGSDSWYPNFNSAVSPYCQVAYVAVCGNGVVEPGEACDDNSGCCTSSCQLSAGAQCSGNSTCCLQATCSYAPSSVQCGAGKGFCANGACALSSCPASLPFCGLDASTGGCRQSCSGAGLCSSTAWSYNNLNLPDGTVCSSQGGTCLAGQCQSPTHTSANAVTYAWTQGSWPAACPCSGNETRAVSCVGTQGAQAQVYADSYCASTGQAKPATWQSCAVPASCFPYAWQYSAWSACSASCDGGTQQRVAQCTWQSSPPTQVDAANCASLAQQPLTAQCNTAACAYQYVVSSSWSACSASCGGGTQTRTTPTTCQRSINGAWQQQPLASCQAALHYAVNDTQTCNSQQCDTYAWQYGSWTACSVACGGGGVQTRSSWCQDVTTGTQADASHCASLGSPVVSASCGSAACPSYQYVYGNWSACTATCGGGTMTRSAQCYDSTYGAWYGLSVCSAVLGAANTSAVCGSAACPVATYEWQWSAWGACPVVCGGGNQTRQVACVSLTPVYMPVASSYCPAAAKPTTWQACGQKSCSLYSWSVTAWSNCSAQCGGGVQTRAVYCQNFWTGALSDPSTCSAVMSSPQPASAQVCNTQACSAAADPVVIGNGTALDGWLLGAWGQCSSQCGGGWQYRTVSCSGDAAAACTALTVTLGGNSSSTTLYDNSTGLVPSGAQQCNTALCPAVWQTGDWSHCSVQCGGGWMNRSVSCVAAVSVDGSDEAEVVVVGDERCEALSRPSVNGDCNFAPCPAYAYTDWSACSAVCGQGVSTRSALCSRYDGLELSASQCAGQAVDALSRVCSSQACPHLHLAPWSDCDRPCGGRGSQQRQLTCRLPHTADYEGMAVSMEQCVQLLNQSDSSAETASWISVDGPGATMEDSLALPLLPATSRACNPAICPAYYWLAVPVSANGSLCSAACGGGEEPLTVGCYSGVDDAQVDESYCLQSARPSSSRACNVQQCGGPAWASSGWSDCSAVCGSGWQFRNASCVSQAGQAVDDTLCPLVSQPAVAQRCVQPDSVCWGLAPGVLASSVAQGAQVNGVCDAEAAQCVCRPGYGGSHCEAAPAISEVRLASQSVVVGDVLWVEWASSATIPSVSLSLHRSSSSSSSSANDSTQLEWAALGSYLVQYTANYGEWTWVVPSWLPAGTDYTVRVSWSPSVYSDSPPLTVAESACGYVECGEHGQCSAQSGQCVCDNGWSGADCSVSPCTALRCNWDHAEQCNELAWLLPQDDSTSTSTSSSTSNTTTATTASTAPGQQCVCLDGWTGPRCATPPVCASELVCLHGGDTDLSTVFVDYSGGMGDAHYCGRCKCTGRWQGATCSVCPITCANGGVVDEQCSSCSCPAGYYGSACQSRYYELTLQLELGAPLTQQLTEDAAAGDVAALQRLEQSAAAELATAAGLASLSGAVSVAVTCEQGEDAQHVQLRTRLAYAAVTVASFDVGQSLLAASAGLLFNGSSALANTTGVIAQAATATLAPYRQAAASVPSGPSPARSLLAAYLNLTAMLSDADSMLYSGELLSKLDMGEQALSSVKAVDPTGIDQAALDAIVLQPPRSRFVASQPSPPSSPSSSSSSSTSSSSSSSSGAGPASLPSPSEQSAASSSSSGALPPAVVVAVVLVVAGVLIIAATLLAARYRTKLSAAAAAGASRMACPISLPSSLSSLSQSSTVVVPPASSLTHCVSDPSLHTSASASASAYPSPLHSSPSPSPSSVLSSSQSWDVLPRAALTRLPSSSELEMVSSACSDMPELEYYQRSISDSSVAYEAYQLHRAVSSPEPLGNGYALHDQDEQHQHEDTQLAQRGQLRRHNSMDELPPAPLLLPSLSSA